MDPLSVTASVVGICLFGAKLIAKVSSGVHGVVGAPKAVQELSNELSAVYSALGQLRILLDNPTRRDSHGFSLWENDCRLVLVECNDIFLKIEVLVTKSKLKSQESIKGQVIKRVKWVWEERETINLRDGLERYKGTLMLMLETFNCHQQDAVAEKIRAIHEAVQKLHDDRENIKETFVVLDTGHEAFNNTELILSDKRNTTPPQPQPSPQQHISPGRHTAIFRGLKSWKPLAILELLLLILLIAKIVQLNRQRKQFSKRIAEVEQYMVKFGPGIAKYDDGSAAHARRVYKLRAAIEGLKALVDAIAPPFWAWWRWL